VRIENAGFTFDIRPVEANVVQVELAADKSKLRLAFGISAEDARKLGRGLTTAARAAKNKKAAETSTRIATRLLKKAAR
jgi:hypothetical protein